MAKIPKLSDLFMAAAEVEANTPITVGAKRRFSSTAHGESVVRQHWVENFPLKEMRRLKFSLPSGPSDADVILQYFGVPSPERWQAKWNEAPVAFRQTQLFEARNEAVAAWVREAEIIADQIPLKDFDEGSLLGSLKELRRLTRDDTSSALTRAQEICSQCGVALVLVPELPKTRISGCARWLDDKHALVGLTPRYLSGEQLWFTFFHEVGHILLHRERQAFVVDNAVGDMGDDVVDPEMVKVEAEADRFAADTLIPPTDYSKLPRKPEELTNDVIKGFAKSIGIHPGIVIGRLQHDKILEHWQGNKLKQPLKWDFVPRSN